MFQLEEAVMASLSCIEPVYADGICGFLNLGGNFATVYYRFQPVPSVDGFRYEKVPIASIVRPKSSIVSCMPGCGFNCMIGAQLPMERPKFGLMGGH